MTTKAEVRMCACGCGEPLKMRSHNFVHTRYNLGHNPNKMYTKRKNRRIEQQKTPTPERHITATRPEACLKCGALNIYQGMPSMESPFVWWECFMCGMKWFN